jgi:hypothetical protein
MTTNKIINHKIYIAEDNIWIPGREKLCPGKTLSGKNSAGKNSVPILICLGKILSRPAGTGKIYRPAPSARNF